MTPSVTADEALERLLAGNRRFLDGTRASPDAAQAGAWAARRQELVAGQQPIAAVLSCSDSRVVPEIIFDQGLGDLFVVRVAGNIVTGVLAASLEYAAHHLSVPLILVLGHTGCGAVQVALSGIRPPGDLGTLVDAIEPALVLARREPGPLLDNAVRANVGLSVDRVRSIPNVRVVGAVYDLATGLVALL
jgi:carbonic anhydrase